jgi:hypothetical protein
VSLCALCVALFGVHHRGHGEHRAAQPQPRPA